jgi:hypothetical protein
MLFYLSNPSQDATEILTASYFEITKIYFLLVTILEVYKCFKIIHVVEVIMLF